jgi:large subunit ribosomal protein L22
MPAVADRETVRAQARYVRSSARKARLVLEHIRGKSAVEARSILAFETRAIAVEAGKVLASAMANAETNNGHDPDDLVVVAAYADEGPTLKRWRPRARGRVNRINKRTCHITIQLAVAEPGEIKRRPQRPTPTQPARKPRGKSATAPIEPKAEPAVEVTAGEPAEVVEEPAAEVAEPKPKPKPARKPRAKKPAEPAVEQPVATTEPEPTPEPVSEPEPESAPEPAAEAETPADETDEEKSE